jgi:hypothetical protein
VDSLSRSYASAGRLEYSYGDKDCTSSRMLSGAISQKQYADIYLKHSLFIMVLLYSGQTAYKPSSTGYNSSG